MAHAVVDFQYKHFSSLFIRRTSYKKVCFHYRYANTHTLISPSKQRAAKKEGDTKQKQVGGNFFFFQVNITVLCCLRVEEDAVMFICTVSPTFEIMEQYRALKTDADLSLKLKNIMDIMW